MRSCENFGQLWLCVKRAGGSRQIVLAPPPDITSVLTLMRINFSFPFHVYFLLDLCLCLRRRRLTFGGSSPGPVKKSISAPAPQMLERSRALSTRDRGKLKGRKWFKRGLRKVRLSLRGTRKSWGGPGEPAEKDAVGDYT